MKSSLFGLCSFAFLSLLAAEGCDPAEPAGAAGAAGTESSAGSGGSDAAGAGGSDAAGAGGSEAAGSGGSNAAGSGGGGPKVALCGETSVCTRPTTTPLSAPYFGAPGELGCAINARCDVEIGQNQGKCIPVGCFKEKGDPTIPATLNGTANCNAPLEFSFEGKASEIYRFNVNISVPGQGGGGVNAGAVLKLNGTPVQESGNDVGFYGNPIPGEPMIGERVYSLRSAGTYTWSVFVEQCAPITITGGIQRLHEADPNLTQQTAAPVASGVTAEGTLNCEEERWFILAPTAGQTLRFNLSGGSVAPLTGGGASATVMDSNLQALSESGNDVAINAEFTDGTPVTESRDVTFASGGVHYVRLRFWNGCAASTYKLSVVTP